MSRSKLCIFCLELFPLYNQEIIIIKKSLFSFNLFAEVFTGPLLVPLHAGKKETRDEVGSCVCENAEFLDRINVTVHVRWV